MIDNSPILGDGILVLGDLWIYTSFGPINGFENVGNIQGPRGYTGDIGYFGSTGYTGSQGDIGYFGSTGYTGSQGDIGYFGSTGYDGSQGTTGYYGSTGYDGSQGCIGYTGSVGYAGSVGQGFTLLGDWVNGYSYVPYDVVVFGGETYVNILATSVYLPTFTSNWTKILTKGDIGYSGSQGCIGYVGSTGYTGSLGCIGYVGSTGYTGSQGISGYTGSRGIIGYTGSRGYIGSLGYAGSAGCTGPQGPQGYTGYTGSQGTGLQISGYVGSSGALPIPYGGSIGTIYASGDNSHLWIWVGAMWVDLGAIGYTGSGGGGGTGGSPNLDGGEPWTNYGGIASICGGGVSV